jgi:3',5'-cyclic AMP phosphodiesterase CpdA
MLLAQITDTHIKADGKLAYGKVDTAAYLARAVEALNALHPRPDLVVVTGDLVDFGRVAEYERLRALLAPLRIPCFLLVGNHDARAELRSVFADHAYLRQGGAFVQYAIEDWPVRIVALDTMVPMQGGGALCAERLDWLEGTLAQQPGRPTIVAMHHPPFVTGIGHMDKQGLADAAPLAAIVRRFANVERIICGHLHRDIQVRFAGTVAGTCPSVAHQVALDLRDDAPSRFKLEPPGFQLHYWSDADGLRTHTAFIGDFAGPYPFFDNSGALIDA